MMLLAMWLPATNHCYFELAGIIKLDDCCSKGQASGKDDPCESGCKLVAKAALKIQADEKPRFVQVLLPIRFVEFLPVLQAAELNEPRQQTAWPPDILSIPQFVASKARPVRAPSLS